MQKDRPEWSSGAKGVRFAHVAKNYRVLLLFGDNIGDFSDRYNGSMADRDQAFEALKAHFGHDWMMLANPSYGSWESATCGHNYKLSADEKRAKKIGVLRPWPAQQEARSLKSPASPSPGRAVASSARRARFRRPLGPGRSSR